MRCQERGATVIRVGLLGSNGRMGQWVSRLLREHYRDRMQLAAEIDRSSANDAWLGDIDVVIDFSSPAAMSALARLALRRAGSGQHVPAFVVGSTGWNKAERHVLDELARKTTVFESANFSTGVYALLEALHELSPLLSRLGYKPVIVERHHPHKKDSPSGTALAIQQAIDAKAGSDIPTHSIRAGEVIGDHEITFYGAGDQLTLSHHAQDRSIFARGAIEVALAISNDRSQPLPRFARGRVLKMRDYFAHLKKNKGGT